MTDDPKPKRPWATKSAAHRFGFVACVCNPNALPSAEIYGPCTWCWAPEDGVHRRFVTIERMKEYRREYGLPEDDEDDIETSPQARSALQDPPHLPDSLPGSGDRIPDTDPSPGFKPPIKREED